MDKIRLIDINKALSQYGINGTFKSHHKVIRSLDDACRTLYGSIEKGASIDTQYEALTAFYYCSQITITEMLKGTLGALKLGVMWMKKKAEDPKADASCQKALKIIMEKSSVTQASHNPTDANLFEIAKSVHSSKHQPYLIDTLTTLNPLLTLRVSK